MAMTIIVIWTNWTNLCKVLTKFYLCSGKVFVIFGRFFFGHFHKFFADVGQPRQFFLANSYLSKLVWAILHLPKSLRELWCQLILQYVIVGSVLFISIDCTL